MTSKELRIGNIVLARGAQSVVKSIDENHVGYLKSKKAEEKVPITLIKPIPLTEKWLVKFGAKKEKDICVHDRFILSYKEAYNFWYVTNLDGFYIKKVEFVHEWQNFYFFLNGKELTIKN